MWHREKNHSMNCHFGIWFYGLFTELSCKRAKIKFFFNFTAHPSLCTLSGWMTSVSCDDSQVGHENWSQNKLPIFPFVVFYIWFFSWFCDYYAAVCGDYGCQFTVVTTTEPHCANMLSLHGFSIEMTLLLNFFLSLTCFIQLFSVWLVDGRII